MPISHRRDHPYGDRAGQHRQQQPRGDHHRLSTQQSYQSPSLKTIREAQVPQHPGEREQRHQPDRSWHQGRQQDRRWQHHHTWHGWHDHPRPPQQQNPDLASQRPIGAGREWDSYILQRKQHQLSLERSSSSLILLHQLGQRSKMEDSESGFTSISFTWRHLGMLRLCHLHQPR